MSFAAAVRVDGRILAGVSGVVASASKDRIIVSIYLKAHILCYLDGIEPETAALDDDSSETSNSCIGFGRVLQHGDGDVTGTETEYSRNICLGSSRLHSRIAQCSLWR